MKDDKKVSIGFTSDIWSSSVSPMLMRSLTSQFIDEKFKLKRVVVLILMTYLFYFSTKKLVAKLQIVSL